MSLTDNLRRRKETVVGPHALVQAPGFQKILQQDFARDNKD